MASTVARDFSEINKAIREINQSSKEAAKEAKALNNAIAADPKSFDLMSQKAQNLQRNIKTATDNVARLKSEQQKYISSGGDLNSKEYNKLSIAVLNAETNAKKLNTELKGVNKQLASGEFSKFSISLDKANRGLETAKQRLQGLARAAQMTLLAITGMTVAFTKQGDAIDKLNVKYNVGVEEIQRQRYIYDRATGSADNYTSVLDRLNRTAATARKGSAETLKVFEQLGITQEKLANMNLEETYNAVVKSLSEITDETQRANLASELLGNQGLTLASIAALETEELTLLNEQLEANGILTKEQTSAAAALADTWTDIKGQFSVVTAQLVTALMPAIMAFIKIIQEVIVPIIQRWANWLGNLSEGQIKAIIGIIGIIAILPKLIAAVQAAIKVIGFLRTALTFLAAHPVIAFIMAIVAAVILLIKAWQALMRLLGKNVEVAADVSVPNLSEYQKTLTSGAEVKTVEEKNINHKIEIEATGDTPLSQQNANLIGDRILADIDEMLGAKL